MVDGVEEVWRDGSEALSEIANVAWVRLDVEKLIDDGQKVVKRGDACERCRPVGTLSSAGGSEQESGLDDLERDAAIEESGCEAAVGASGEAGRAGCASVQSDDLLGVALAGGHGFQALACSAPGAWPLVLGRGFWAKTSK
jgi:hypothetical protein